MMSDANAFCVCLQNISQREREKSPINFLPALMSTAPENNIFSRACKNLISASRGQVMKDIRMNDDDVRCRKRLGAKKNQPLPFHAYVYMEQKLQIYSLMPKKL